MTVLLDTRGVKSVYLCSYCYNQEVIVQGKFVTSHQVVNIGPTENLFVRIINLDTFCLPKIHFSFSLQWERRGKLPYQLTSQNIPFKSKKKQRGRGGGEKEFRRDHKVISTISYITKSSLQKSCFVS